MPNGSFAFLNFGGSCVKVKIDFEQGNKLNEGISIFDILSVDDFNQFKKIEGSVTLKCLIKKETHCYVSEEFWAGQL